MSKRPRIGVHIVANAAGSAAALAFAVVFTPLYLRLLGAEAYGLVGLFTTLLALFAVLDMGLSTTLNRALARLGTQPERAERTRALFAAFERLYGVGALLIGGAIAALAVPIARNWVHLEQLDTETVTGAIRLMGLVAACQWPHALYAGVLLGLERQVRFNVIKGVMAAVRGIGALAVLLFVSPTIEAFFSWQALVSLAHALWLRRTAVRALPATSRRPRPDWAALRARLRFAGALAAISITVTILTQLDKVVLTRLLALETFGYYSFAASLGAALGYVAQPFFQALFPRLSALHARGDTPRLAALYHTGAELLSVAVIPPALTLILFTPEVLWLWSRDAVLVERASVLVRWLVAGFACNALVTLPYALQLATGWTRLTLIKNVIAIALLAPLLYVWIGRFGAAGAAAAWFVLNLGYVLFEIPFMHRRLLRGHAVRWYVRDVGAPLLAASLSAGTLRGLVPSPRGLAAQAALVGGALVIAFASACALSPAGRGALRRTVAVMKSMRRRREQPAAP